VGDVGGERRARPGGHRGHDAQPNPDWETMNALFHPDHEFLPRDVGLVGGGVRGAQGYREWLTNISETMEWEVMLAEVTRSITSGCWR
jgi:hypothetical protein